MVICKISQKSSLKDSSVLLSSSLPLRLLLGDVLLVLLLDGLEFLHVLEEFGGPLKVDEQFGPLDKLGVVSSLT